MYPAIARSLAIAGLVALMTALAAPGAQPALAQGAAPAATPPAQTYSPSGEPMAFRLAEGNGPRGARRWISGTGQIQANSATQFAAFRKANDVDGLTVVLDSTGGRVNAAMALGRAIRAAKMNTTVGRTITVGDKDAVLTRDVGCSSACVLLLMAGVERFVSEDASVNVHMFSVELDAEGNKARADLGLRDIEQTQRTMARHAVYVAEMGIAARFLEIMTEASFKGAMRRITGAEMRDIKLASVAPREITGPIAAIWSISAPSSRPQLIRSARLLEDERMAVDHELLLECDVVRNFYVVTYRQVMTRQSGQTGVGLDHVRFESGGWDYILRAPGRTLRITTQGNDLWIRRSIPRKVFEDAAQNRKLDLIPVAAGQPARSGSLYDASLIRFLPELARRCDSRPGLVSVGPNPRR